MKALTTVLVLALMAYSGLAAIPPAAKKPLATGLDGPHSRIEGIAGGAPVPMIAE